MPLEFVMRSRALVLALTLAVPTVASAQTSGSSRTTTGAPSSPPSDPTAEREARLLFDAGTVAYEAGRYEDALDRFRAAYARLPHPLLQYNIGQAADHLRRDDEALVAFEAFLRDAPAAAPHRAEIESRVAVLRRVIAERDANAAASASPRGTTGSNGTSNGGGARTDGSPNALSPEAVARASATPATNDAPHATPITKKWWFWTSVAGVVVLAVVLPVVLTRGDHYGPHPTGDVGGTVFTLEGSR